MSNLSHKVWSVSVVSWLLLMMVFKAEGNSFIDPEVTMNVSQIIQFHGYPVEEYTVETADGFLLGVQRIPHGRLKQRGGGQNGRQAVFLQHGLLASSSNWVTNLPNESFGFLLADAGFDVWLGNVRGNTYSRRHVKYKPDTDRFWNWSWDEMAQYDLPAMLTFVLNRTGNKPIYYVGHSQGTTIAFALFSKNQRLSEKVKAFFALAPVTTVKKIKSPIRYFAPLTYEIEMLFFLLGHGEFLSNDWLVKLLARTVCEDRDLQGLICSNIIFLICGFDKPQLNMTRLPIYVSHNPAGTSVKDLGHFLQMVRSGKFQMYDYGFLWNKKTYGQWHPPEYSVANVTVPTALYLAENDWLVDSYDADRLVSQIRRPIGIYHIPAWDHLDFVWGMDAATLLYKPIIEMMINL